MTVQYLALGTYCLLCKALVTCIVLYLTPSIAFDPRGMLRSISGIMVLQRTCARFILSVLFCHIYVILLLLAEAYYKSQPLLLPIAALMLSSGIGIACFDVDTHWEFHFLSLVGYIFLVTAYSNLLALIESKFLYYAIFLDVVTTLFLIWFFYNLAFRDLYWDSTQTVLELLWFFGLYAFFSRCCMFLANKADLAEKYGLSTDPSMVPYSI